MPFEISLCLKKWIESKYFTLEELNNKIHSFQYCFSDQVNRPQKIPKTFSSKKTIGGNAHENWTLLRLISLMIGGLVPESDKTWDLIMDLKDIVELVVSQKLTVEAVWYLESKISCHRELFKEVFPDAYLRPKHHFLEHYPHLICCFGPLVDLWTMRFEAKHSFFKKVVHETQNFRNLLKTLSNKHQLMMACTSTCRKC